MSKQNSSAIHRAPLGPWGRAWLLALLVTILLLSSWETWWRKRGHKPSVSDSIPLWVYHRARAADNNNKTLVLTGGSRIQLGIDKATLQRLLPGWTIVHLAVDGRTPRATIQDLASDPAFRGRLLVSVTAAGFLLSAQADQQAWVDAYHTLSTLDDTWNAYVVAQSQERLVSLSVPLHLRTVLTHRLRYHEWPGPWYARMDFDRFRQADYRLLDIPRFRQRRVDKVRRRARNAHSPTPSRWLTEAVTLEPFVCAITERGGSVAFVRFPTTGIHWEVDEQLYPKHAYWDRFAATTSAITIHFKDEPTLQGFDCPDTSHLDRRDTPRFTRSLVTILRREGFFSFDN